MVSLLYQKRLNISDSVNKQQLAGSSKRDKRPARGRPSLPRVSEGTSRVAALIETEAVGWKGVSTRPMFGMTALYRGRRVFAVLPRTRAFGASDAIGLRFPKPSGQVLARMRDDERIVRPHPGGKWTSFLIKSDADVHTALEWLELAYRQASK